MNFEISVTRDSKNVGKRKLMISVRAAFNSGLVKIRVRRQMVKLHKIFYTVEEHRHFFAK